MPLGLGLVLEPSAHSYEAVYLRELADGRAAEREIDDWFRFYNHVRPHSSLEGRTPCEAYRGRWRKAA